MTPQQFSAGLRRKQEQLKRYAYTELPGMVARKTLRFIDGNFRAQGYQGPGGFQRWKPNTRKGTILIKKGHLRRSFRQQVAPGEVRTWSNSPYARPHNEGFKGPVQIKAHQRRRFQAERVGTGRFNKNGTERKKTIHTVAGVANVKAHTRNVKLPRRQFMPTGPGDAPVLMKSIERQVVKDLKQIFG